MELTIYKIAFIIATFKFKPSFSSFLSFDEIASKLYFIVVPRLSTKSMLLIIMPLTFIHRSVSVDEYAQSISFSVCPFSLINVSICMGHPTFTIELLVLCHSLVS